MAKYENFPVILDDELMEILQYNVPSEMWNVIFEGMRNVMECYRVRGQDELLEREVARLRGLISLQPVFPVRLNI